MKKWFIIAALLMSCMVLKAQDRIKWMDFEDAIAACEKTPKKIFVDVYTDWCGWCVKMDQTTFQDSAVVSYINEKFYAVKFNAERNDTVRFQGRDFVYVKRPGSSKGVHQLAAAMLQNKMSYPSYVIFNEEQQLVQVIPGYHKAEEFAPMIHFFGDDAYKTTPWPEFVESFNQGDEKKLEK